MRGNVIAEVSAMGRLTSTVSKSSARKEIMNDNDSKDGNISAESSIFGRRIADQQGSFLVLYLHWLTKTTTREQIYKKIDISAESSIFGRRIADQQGSFLVLYLHWLTKTTTTREQIYKKIETKHLGQNQIILSGLSAFWDSRFHCQRYTSVHFQKKNKRRHACNPSVTYFSVARAVNRVTYAFIDAIS